MMKDKHINVLEKVKKELVKDMEVEEVILHMTGVLSKRDEGEIRKEPTTRMEKCVKLLEILPCRGAKAYDSFITALREGSTPHLVDVIKAADLDKKKTQSSSEAYHKEIIAKHQIKFSGTLDPCPLVDYLIEMNIITEDDRKRERILSDTNNNNKTKEEKRDMSIALLSNLKKKGPEAFQKLVEGLKENQPSLAFILLEEEKMKLKKLLAEKDRMLTEKNSKEIKTLEEKLQLAEKDNNKLSEECHNLKEQIENFKTTLPQKSLKQQFWPIQLQDVPGHEDNFNVAPMSFNVFNLVYKPPSGTQATGPFPALPIPSTANPPGRPRRQSENVKLPHLGTSKPSNLPKSKLKKKANNNPPGSYF